MTKAEELLQKMDAEILEKTNAIVMQKDAEFKEEAQKAYDAKVEEKIAEVKAEVEGEYKVAREYLEQIIASEKTSFPTAEPVKDEFVQPEAEVVAEPVKENLEPANSNPEVI